MADLSPSIRYLREMIAIPSVNPMGRDDLPVEITGEQAIAEHVAHELSRLGLDSELIGRAGRTSVVAEATAHAGAETLLVASHLDTVPVDGMVIDPFDPVIETGHLLGRGSCDTKAGMAALLEALERVLERGRLKRNIMIVGEADEELGSIGVADVLAHLGSRRPDWVLATEPTNLRLINAHKGVVHARVCARGRACHSSDPTAGRNAIVLLARAILAIEADAKLFLERPHPELGAATLSIGIVQGGQAPNIVPDQAQIWVDRRTLPGESPEAVRVEIEASLVKAGVAADVVVESCSEEKPPLETASDSLAAVATAAALESVGLPPSCDHVAFGTDAGVFGRAGIPGVVLGPGSIDVAHTSREFVPIAEVEIMVRIFERLLEGEAGPPPSANRSE
jgi:acetylornithine deacetylase/succinyl-diaminopimelate desuccinylase-like protein